MSKEIMHPQSSSVPVSEGAANGQSSDVRSVVEPRMMRRAEAAIYCGVSKSTFSRWVSAGILPEPLSGTARWDRRAIDEALDGGRQHKKSNRSPLDIWREARDARSTEGNP